jgi:thiamine transporter
VAFTLLGLAGIGSGKKGGLFWGACIGAVLRFLSHYVAGATIWAEWMPEEFVGIPMTSPWIYSAIYNGIPVGLSLVATMIVLAALYAPLKKYLTKVAKD